MTAAEAIRRALGALRMIAPNATLSSDDGATGLAILQTMLSDWENQALLPNSLNRQSFALTGAASYTIGAAQTFNVAMPTKISYAAVKQGNIDYPVDIVDAASWDSIPDKTTAGRVVEKLFYLPGTSTGTVYVWPRAGDSITLEMLKKFTLPSSGTDVIDLPARYNLALIYSLAELLSPEYEATHNATVLQKAFELRAALKAANSIRPQLMLDPTLARIGAAGRGRYSILNG